MSSRMSCQILPMLSFLVSKSLAQVLLLDLSWQSISGSGENLAGGSRVTNFCRTDGIVGEFCERIYLLRGVGACVAE
jgi:hypothetical protein